MATVEPFTEIHLWLLPIAKNVIGQPRVGPPVLALHMWCIRLGAQGPSDFSFSFLFLFFPFRALISGPHLERLLGVASSLSGF